MRVEYSKRATADLRKAAADSRAFGDAVTTELEARIRELVAHVAAHPEAGQRVAERPGVWVVPLIRYPYRLFYRILPDRVKILHIRHTSRRSWTPNP